MTGRRSSTGRRVVLVIGASSGIGRATAHRLARRGDALLLASRSSAALAEVVAECRRLAPRRTPEPVAMTCDVADAGSVEAVLARAVAHAGRLDAVVLTAAVNAYGRLDEIPAPALRRVVEVDLLGSALVAGAALRTFATQGRGHLVLTGSVLGTIATPGMGAYSISKWGVEGLARTLQVEAPRGVHVSLVRVGPTDTPIYLQSASYDGWGGRPPPPVSTPERVARVITRRLDHPRRVTDVGVANSLMRFAFRRLPGTFDAVVRPAMRLTGRSARRVGVHDGNVFAPQPRVEAVHGRWRRGRRWTLALAGGAALALTAARAADSPTSLR